MLTSWDIAYETNSAYFIRFFTITKWFLWFFSNFFQFYIKLGIFYLISKNFGEKIIFFLKKTEKNEKNIKINTIDLRKKYNLFFENFDRLRSFLFRNYLKFSTKVTRRFFFSYTYLYFIACLKSAIFISKKLNMLAGFWLQIWNPRTPIWAFFIIQKR